MKKSGVILHRNSKLTIKYMISLDRLLPKSHKQQAKLRAHQMELTKLNRTTIHLEHRKEVEVVVEAPKIILR